MSYRVKLIPEAHADLKALSGYVRAQALELMDELSADPRPHRAKELRGKTNIYRIWLAGRWRIAYQIDDGAHYVYVLRIRLKERIDYESLTSWVNEPQAPYG